MRVLLVSPNTSATDATPGWLCIPQLALPILAALTPPEHEVVMVQEERESLPLDGDWDVVGISAMTATAPRAYELAGLFRGRGAKVILGGIHPSVLPDEAAQFADAVVVGEAEGVWQEVLSDAQHNRLRPFYHNPQPDLSASPLPVRTRRRSLFGLPPYVMPVMASRGCPYDCEFCCVRRVYGRGQRHVPIGRIVEDIARSRARRLMFLDDNIGAERSYAMRLFAALKPLKVRWSGQAAARFILDDELFDAAVRSGLEGLFVGIESIEPEALRTMRKSLLTLHLYEKAIQRCRAAHVIFHASLIFGLDEQTPHVFDRTLEFLLGNAVPSISPNILTPYPGTRLFERLTRERRILHTNWSYYDHSTVCYQPKTMEPEQLTQKYLDFRSKFYAYSSIVRRWSGQWLAGLPVYLGMNLAYRTATRRQKGRVDAYFRWLRQGKRDSTLEGAKAPPARSALKSLDVMRRPLPRKTP